MSSVHTGYSRITVQGVAQCLNQVQHLLQSTANYQRLIEYALIFNHISAFWGLGLASKKAINILHVHSSPFDCKERMRGGRRKLSVLSQMKPTVEAIVYQVAEGISWRVPKTCNKC